MTTLTISTWNINSVRLRLFNVERHLQETDPDVLCLQETKVSDAQFPAAAFRKLGFPHIAVNGGKGGYHGVAIVSRLPLTDVSIRTFCGKAGDPRHVAAVVETGGQPVRIHNFYVPAGGDEPDPLINPKFAHKLDFLAELATFLPEEAGRAPSVVVGDLNVAPYAEDVWSTKALNRIVSHTPVERAALEKARLASGYVDLARAFVPMDQKLYSWWSYRAKDWRAADRGRRLDHLWAHPDLARRATRFEILKDVRGWSRASDHVPVVARFDMR
jgi:exodeoxyribonuclease III